MLVCKICHTVLLKVQNIVHVYMFHELLTNYRNNGLKAPAFKRGDERQYFLPATQVLSSIEYMKCDIIVLETYVGGAFHVYSTPFA